MTTRRRFLATLATGSAAVAIAACAPAATGGTQGGAAKPAKTTWTTALDFKINAIDLGITDEWRGILGHYYESLIDTVGPEFKFVPRLATSWSRASDTTWRFNLRKGVKFHDGTELKAADVEYSILAYVDPKHPQNYRVPWFAGVKVVDDYTVDVTTKTANLAAQFDFARIYVMSKAARLKDVAGANVKPIGSGPYQVVSWAPNDRLTLKAFPDYWRGVAKPETLVFREIPDPTTAASELVTGGVDIVRNVDFLQAGALKGTPTLEFSSVTGGQLFYNYIRTDKPPFNDKRVRQAMNYALDRKKLIDTVLFGFGQLQNGPLPKGFRGYDPDLKPYAYDPAKAKALLTEAGYPNGFKTTWDLSVATYPSPIWKQYLEAATAQFKAIGVDVAIEPYSGAAGNRKCDTVPPIGAISTNLWGLTSDPTTYFNSSYVLTPCNNTPRTTEFLQKAVAAPDLESRTKALQELGKVMQDEANQLENISFDLLVAKTKDIPYQAATSTYANGAGYIQFYDVTSLKPLEAVPGLPLVK